MPACAGLEPDVEDVHLFAELCAAAAAQAVPAGSRVGDVVVYQASAPSLSKRSTMLLVDGVSLSGFVALVAEEDGDGHAPDALAGDAPVGAGGDHVGDALLAPGRVPDDLVDLVEGALAEGGLACRRRASSGFPCR